MPRLPRHALVALLVLAALPPRPARSQEDDPEALERRVEELRREEKELAGKLEEVRRLLAEAERAHQLARARVTARAMRARIEELTPRRFEHDVQVGFQTKEEFRRSVLELMEQEYPPEVARGQAAALTALGLVPPGTDLRETLVAAALSQAAAYYDPRKDTFYVVMELPRGQEEAIFLHELQHAMQDQRLGLDETWRAALASGNEDSQQAFRFLAEGEATYLMTVFGARKILGKAGTQAETELIRFFRQRAETPHAVLLREMKARAGVLGGDMAEAFEGARDLPPFVLRSLYDAYYRGAYTVARVKEAKGWAGIDELFRDPPRSTEQMLHPQKLLGPEREEPIEVRLPEQPDGLGEGWMKVHESTFGEASLIILLTEQLPEEEGDNARAAAATPPTRGRTPSSSNTGSTASPPPSRRFASGSTRPVVGRRRSRARAARASSFASRPRCGTGAATSNGWSDHEDAWSSGARWSRTTRPTPTTRRGSAGRASATPRPRAR
ncbi:MAG: hypothetical protein ACE5JG_08130 [Planctomycetota bacterium]